MATFACGQCGAALAFDGVRTATCPFCASPNVAERPPSAGQPDPRFVVTFVGDAELARRSLQRWLGSRGWFADSALRRAKVEDLRGVYVPAYLYSAVGRTSFTAQIGEHYTEEETYTTSDGKGGTERKTRTVTRTEHRPLAGSHVGYVTDVVVSASTGLPDRELASLEPFDLRQIRRFAPGLVSGWIAEEFSRPLDHCTGTSRGEALDVIGDRLRGYMPGDSYSDLAYRTQVSWESMEPILVPVWMFAVRYRDDRPPLRVAINGQTGKIAGKVPLAWWRIVLAIALAAAAIAGLVLLLRGR
ncbi:MAG TPA: hypothetical protein VLX92_19995 [Kofleriaceae bacterium]|nr:hypothetical protein [Kofleriaceae bacterium]